MVASSFKLPAPLKAVLTGHYGCLLKTRQGKEELSRESSPTLTQTYTHKYRTTRAEIHTHTYYLRVLPERQSFRLMHT